MLRTVRSRLAACAAAGAAILALAPVPATGEAAPTAPATPHRHASDKSEQDFDIRKAARDRGVPATARIAASQDIRAELGQQAMVDIDELTGTPRLLARADGFLTGPSSLPPQEIALRYLREHQQVVGMSETDLSNLTLRKDYVDIAGTHHLSFVQQAGGLPLFGNGLKAHVAKDGRLIQVDGSPVRDLPATLAATSTAPPDKEKSKKVAFYTGTAVRPAWSTLVRPKHDVMYLQVVDAENGSLLYRKNLIQHANPDDAQGLAWGAGAGKQRPVDLDKHGWLPADAKTLDGNVGHVAADVNGDEVFQPEEEIHRNADGTFKFPFKDFSAEVGGLCSAKYPCSWNPKKPDSWKVNREQNAVQVMYYLGTFHDHLAAAPIGFTRAAGNFEKIDGDAVQAHTLYSAAKAEPWYNNAFMGTPPDGESPIMGMYLFNDPNDPEDPFVAGNSGDSAAVLYHEYTHGLSHRLVVDASGVDTLDSTQSAAMGEAWSDWYAIDYLVGERLTKDTPAPGELVNGADLTAGANLVRTQPMDCPVGTTSARCPGTSRTGPGGYTYGDYGRVFFVPQVHSDGEIWGQTLWDLRTELGVQLTRSLVTRAMELSPASPSFLDMRNSILQADTVTNGGKAHKRIWQVFAKRGMGFFAGSVTGDDVNPAEDFSMPPPANTPRGKVSGKVTDADTGAPVAGVQVRISGHDSGFGGELSTVTGADGRYQISGVIPGTYPKAYAFGNGMDASIRALSVRSADNTADWSLRRNWATTTMGASVVAFSGEDWPPNCNSAFLLQHKPVPSGGGGWSTDRKTLPDGTMVPRFATFKLGQPVDLKAVEVDPSNICSDDRSAAAKDVTVETSTDGTTWVMAGRTSFTPQHLGARHSVPLTAGTAKVRFVRLTMLSNQLSFQSDPKCDDPVLFASGCFYTDIAALAIRGTG